MAIHEIYHALGDPVRLELVERLVARDGQSTTELVSGLGMTRQAATKHLVVLESAGLVQSETHGRVVVRKLNRLALVEAESWLSKRARTWEHRLGAFAKFVEAREESEGHK